MPAVRQKFHLSSCADFRGHYPARALEPFGAADLSRSTLTITSSISVPQQLLPVARRGRGRRARRSRDRDRARPRRLRSSLGEHARALILAACEFCLRRLKRSEAFLPCALEAARDEAVVWIDGTIAALGKACRIARPLDAKPPVLQRGLPVGLEPLGGSQRRCDLGWLERGNESARHRLVDLHTTDVEAIAAAPLDEMLAPAQ